MDELMNAVLEMRGYAVSVTDIPFTSPVHLPFGDIHSRPSVWLKIRASVDGVITEGAAEGTALPASIPMYDDSSANIEQNVASILNYIGPSKVTVSDVVNSIGSMNLSGSFMTARMTVESAIIDTIARSKKRSVVSYLDSKPPGYTWHIPYGKSIAESSRENILAAAKQAFSNGARRLKFKLSPDNYSELYPALRSILKAYPDISCMVDANGMFNPENQHHIEMLASIDKLRLLTIEEPVSRAGRFSGIEAYKVLVSKLRLQTPVTADDAIKSLDDARWILNEGIAHIVNLKPGRMGSFVRCVELADYAKTIGKEVMVGGMFEATPGRMMTLSLAAYCIKQGFQIPGDLSLPQERLSTDLVEDILHLSSNNDVIFRPKTGWGYGL